MLMRCSKAGDMTEWNEWREANPGIIPLLEGGNLQHANLQRADLILADLQGACLVSAKLQGAELAATELQEAYFGQAIVDGRTLIWNCSIDRDTYFGGVGLASARIQPGLRVSLEGNIRRREWEDWYKEHKIQKLLVRPFWWVSDYGMSTSRIMGAFFGLAFLFGVLYYFFPGLVCNLANIPGTQGEPPIPLSSWDQPFRAIYFSVVTMTTLGFGDIYANPHSKIGHILLMAQVLFGYGLLGALITRLGILFQSLGPAQDYSSSKEQQ